MGGTMTIRDSIFIIAISLGFSLPILGLVCGAIVVAKHEMSVSEKFAQHRKAMERLDEEHRQYMRECVPHTPAARCEELFQWTR